jgi:hypothetical protein
LERSRDELLDMLAAIDEEKANLRRRLKSSRKPSVPRAERVANIVENAVAR